VTLGDAKDDALSASSPPIVVSLCL